MQNRIKTRVEIGIVGGKPGRIMRVEWMEAYVFCYSNVLDLLKSYIGTG